MEKRLKTSLNEYQAECDSKFYRGRRFSDRQEYLKLMHKSNRYAVTTFNRNQKTNEDEQKCKFFSDLFPL